MPHQIEKKPYVVQLRGIASAVTGVKQPIEVWQGRAGMNWKIEESSVRCKSGEFGHLGTAPPSPSRTVKWLGERCAWIYSGKMICSRW